MEMISIRIREYEKIEEEGIIEFFVKEREEHVENILELKEKIMECGCILAYKDISQKDIEKFSSINSKFDNIFLARTKNTFFIFGKEMELMEFFEKTIGRSIWVTVNLNKERLKLISEDYSKLLKAVHEEKEKIKRGETPDIDKLDELAKKNELILPFLKENEKRLEKLREFVSNEGSKGVFNSLLREVDETKIYTLETKIKTYSEYANILLQHHTMQMNLSTQESLKKLQKDTKTGINEIVSLEKAIECIYLVAGTYYITHLTLLFLEYYHESSWPILFNFNPLSYIIVIILFSLSLTIITLLCFPKVLEKLKNP